MPQPDLTDLEERVLAAERLLSTLVALLSARDPKLLAELQAVFTDPDFARDRAGREAAGTWGRIKDQLEATGRLVESLNEEPGG